MTDLRIFQPEQAGTKCLCCKVNESDNKEEDKDQELQEEMFNPDNFYKFREELKLSHSIENFVNIHFYSYLISLNHRDTLICKISQKRKCLEQLMNSVFKESQWEGTKLLHCIPESCYWISRNHVSIVKDWLQDRFQGECRKFFEEAQPVGTPVDWARMSVYTAKVIRTPSLIIESTNKIQSNHQ